MILKTLSGILARIVRRRDSAVQGAFSVPRASLDDLARSSWRSSLYYRNRSPARRSGSNDFMDVVDVLGVAVHAVHPPGAIVAEARVSLARLLTDPFNDQYQSRCFDYGECTCPDYSSVLRVNVTPKEGGIVGMWWVGHDVPLDVRSAKLLGKEISRLAGTGCKTVFLEALTSRNCYCGKSEGAARQCKRCGNKFCEACIDEHRNGWCSQKYEVPLHSGPMDIGAEAHT